MSERVPVWVISLERATDRRAFVRQVFGELGVDYEVIDAVDGLQLDERSIRAYSEWRALFRYGRGLGRGMLAASMSHLRAYERMLANDVPEVLIVEDDVRPNPDILRVLDERDRFPSDWDVVTFHSLFEWSRPTPVDDGAIANGYNICTYERTPMGLQAYLINHSAARRVLDIAYPICLPPDELLFRPRPAGLTVYGIEPSPVVHEDFASEIHRTDAPAAVMSTTLAPLQAVVRLAGRADRRLHRRRVRSLSP